MVHNRYTSSNYDLVLDSQTTINTMTSEFNNLVKMNKNCPLNISDWYDIIPSAVYYRGQDELIFKKFYIIIYEDLSTKLLNSVFISKFGEVHYTSIPTDKKSKYYPAVENLSPEFHKSNVRRILAVTCLRAFAMLDSSVKKQLNSRMVELDSWDETTAGQLANNMKLIDHKKPSNLGLKFMDMGFLQTHYISSCMLDIVYSNKTQEDINDNNRLVFSIGEQLDQLFDPLTEYSPEPTEKVYQPPNENHNSDSSLAQSVCQELLQFQKNFTTSLVDFLQNYVLPLRIKVLNGGIKGYTTSKLNVIFPPTIDEVTRINCIYLDALKLAIPYGSYEIIKASGMTIPYFYKAYMRHEAATKNFNANLKSFLRDLHRQGIDEDLVYTKQKIESLIHGSLNLTKIKLILNRLNSCENGWNAVQKSHIPAYLESSTVTIDSFAKDEQVVPYNQRVFTPTGKILTELANCWPTELQYGWLTRRVVAIYDVENLQVDPLDNNEVMVIFSDHILFLKVNEQKDDSDFHRPSISDILMHSLINESPINNISSLSVNGWANIQGVQASTYLDDEMLKILINDNAGMINQYSEPEFTRYYKLSAEKKGSKVIELINKAKILNKTQPFHLFKTRKFGLTIYSTAHDFSNYDQEVIRSPFVIFLKMAVDHQFLVANKIFFALSIFFQEDHLVLRGHFIKSKYNFDKKLKVEELRGFLCGLMSDVYEKYLDYNINTPDLSTLLSSNEETIAMIEAYINDEKPRIPPPQPLRSKQSDTNRRSLELFSTARNISDSSVIHRKKTGDTQRSADSRKSVGSNFTTGLRRRSSNSQNKRSNSLIKTITKVFKSKENLRNGSAGTERVDNQAYNDTENSSSFYETKDFKSPDNSIKPLPKLNTQRSDFNKPAPIKSVNNEKPLSLAQLHTSHSVRRKLSKLMNDLDYNYYDDGENNWVLCGQDSTQVILSDVQLNTKLTNNNEETGDILPVHISSSPGKHAYRSIINLESGSPLDEKFSTPLMEQESVIQGSPATSHEFFQTPYEEQLDRFGASTSADELVESGDSFSITFDDLEDDVGLDVIDVNVYDSLTTIKQQPTHESANRLVDLLEAAEESAEESEDDDFQSPFGDIDYETKWGAHDEDKYQNNDKDIDNQDDTVLINDDYIECGPEKQQFTYKNTEDYQPENDSTIINQIHLTDMTTSDFTMSSDSQQDDEEELRANLTWYSPSELDVLMRYGKDQTFKNKKSEFTSKINIVLPPVKEEVKSNKRYYIPHEDSVKFDEPILRASSYSYLMGVLDDDAEFDMTVIPEDALETTVMYDNRLIDNLKESSVKYLAGYIRDDATDYSDIFEAN